MSGMLNGGLRGDSKWKPTSKMDFVPLDRLYFIRQICNDAVAAVMQRADLKSQGHLTTCSLQARDFQEAKGLESNLQTGCLSQTSKQIVSQNYNIIVYEKLAMAEIKGMYLSSLYVTIRENNTAFDSKSTREFCPKNLIAQILKGGSSNA